MIWKKEWQRRGAPHFHGLLYLSSGESPFVCKDWIAVNWAEVTGDVSDAHIASGTRVEALRSPNGGKFYCAKYMGKDQSIPLGVDTGRLWGVLARKNLPVVFDEKELTKREVAAYRLVVSSLQSSAWARRIFSKSDFTVESPVGFDGKNVVWEREDALLDAWRVLVDEEEERQLEYLTAKPRAIQQHLMTNGDLLERMKAMISIADCFPDSPEAKRLAAMEKGL